MVNENTADNNYGYSNKEIDEILDEQNELVLREKRNNKELIREGNFGYSNTEIKEILEEQRELKLREELEDLAQKDQKWLDEIIKGAEEIAKQQEKEDHEYWKKHGDPEQQQARHDKEMAILENKRAILEQEEWEHDLSRNYFGGDSNKENSSYDSTYDPEDENLDEDI